MSDSEAAASEEHRLHQQTGITYATPVDRVEPQPTLKMKRRRRSSTLVAPDTSVQAQDGDKKFTVTSSDGLSVHASKKLKLLADHSVCSPFPDFHHPSTEDVRDVYALLSSHTPGGAPVHGPPTDSNSATTCGQTPNVIDALIDTILSQNTSSANSSAAKRSLYRVFGHGEPSFEKIAHADRQTIADAIRSGGLANRKAKIIQEALVSVKKKHGRYDLQHFAVEGAVSDEEAMRELVTLNGVGPKTAACVLSLCLGRQAFAVDTHVFRLSRLLGWVPKTADRVGAQAHLELRIPPELKYGLHVMMVRHGRGCRGCKKDGKGPCPLKSWLKERIDMQPDSSG